MARIKKAYVADGVKYFSKTLYDLHVFLSNNKYVKSFTIPQAIKKANMEHKKLQ